MEKQTLLFLESLWNANIQREIVRDLGEDAANLDIKRRFKGVLQSDTIWVSDLAQDLRYRLFQIQDKIHNYERPNQLILYVDDYLNLQGEVQALQIQTAKSLNSMSVIDLQNVHIIVFPMFQMAMRRIKEAVCLELYRVLVLNGSVPEAIKDKFPVSDDLEAWLSYYQKQLAPITEQLPESIADGRWAYEKKTITLVGNLVIEQFISTASYQNEINQLPGESMVCVGGQSNVRITGRGYITNMAPDDILQFKTIKYYDAIKNIKDYSFIKNVDTNPKEIMDCLYQRDFYLISAQEYFSMINQYMISKNIFERIQHGRCICCGSPMEHGFCRNCER